jgi:DNA-binding GntR family transcriptional regulator
VACEKIRAAIVYGPLDLGEPLSENALARALGMSKAPVRAAMSELRLQGLVQVVPQSGTYVFNPTRQEIEALCDFRFLLEGQALQTAMTHDGPALVAGLTRVVTLMREADWTTEEADRPLDRAYHQLFITCCGNQFLADAYENISHRVEALRYRFMHTTVFRHRAFAEHAEMVDLLAAGRASRAVAVLGGHIARTRKFQSNVTWSPGRSRRRDYRFREHADLFRRQP